MGKFLLTFHFKMLKLWGKGQVETFVNLLNETFVPIIIYTSEEQ